MVNCNRQPEAVPRSAGALDGQGAHVLRSFRGAVRADGAAVVVQRHRHALRAVRVRKLRGADDGQIRARSHRLRRPHAALDRRAQSDQFLVGPTGGDTLPSRMIVLDA